MPPDRSTEETGHDDIRGHPPPLVLARYLDGGMAGGQAAGVLAHALVCRACGRRLATLAAARGYRFAEGVDPIGRRLLTILPIGD